MKNFFLFCILLAAISSCKPDPNSGDEPLCSSRAINDSNSLRLGGIYYYISPANAEQASVYILNANGTIGDTGLNLPISNASATLNSSSFMNYMSDNKGYWGVYHIEGSSIFIDTWHVSSNGIDYGYRWTGEILSDTSFRILSSQLCNGSEFSTENKIYYFYPLESKPDSVTSLIP